MHSTQRPRTTTAYHHFLTTRRQAEAYLAQQRPAAPGPAPRPGLRPSLVRLLLRLLGTLLLAALGWALWQHEPPRPLALPDAPADYYRLSGHGLHDSDRFTD